MRMKSRLHLGIIEAHERYKEMVRSCWQISLKPKLGNNRLEYESAIDDYSIFLV